MSNISTDIARAFLAGKTRKIKNSWTDGTVMTLFGNPIATRPHPRVLRLSLGGRSASRTTIARLDAILLESKSGYRSLGSPYNPSIDRDGDSESEDRTLMSDRTAWYVVMLPEVSS